MADKVDRELVTIDGRNVVIKRNTSPIENGGILERAEEQHVLNVFDERFRPSNYNLPDGKPLRLFDAKTVKVDLSKRSVEDMNFWHRNVDAHEIIFCVKGALEWETELGTRVLEEGDMLFIPRGIVHRSKLCDKSAEENILVELKIAEPVEYVGG